MFPTEPLYSLFWRMAAVKGPVLAVWSLEVAVSWTMFSKTRNRRRKMTKRMRLVATRLSSHPNTVKSRGRGGALGARLL